MERRAVTLVALGGFTGAMARHAVTVVLPATFPWGTLTVNVVGSFLLGLLVYGARERGSISPRIRLAVSTGFVSSFTTYSTFAAETVGLAPTLAALNIVGNYALGFLAVLSAQVVIRWRS
jgi:CrcB protein